MGRACFKPPKPVAPSVQGEEYLSRLPHRLGGRIQREKATLGLLSLHLVPCDSSSLWEREPG